MTKKKLKNNQNKMDGLVNSIVEDTNNKINEIDTFYKQEAIALYQTYEQEINSFKKKQSEITTQTIEHSCNKIKNSGVLVKKRFLLNEIEKYIHEISKQALTNFHSNEQKSYIKFLTDSIQSINEVSKGLTITIALSSVDKEYQELLSKYVKNKNISFINQDTILYGGIIVHDLDNNIYYNATLDRLLERKQDEIRTTVHAIIMNKHKTLNDIFELYNGRT